MAELILPNQIASNQIGLNQTEGRVELPRQVYDTLVLATSHPTPTPRPAPSGYALGHATVSIKVTDVAQSATAEIKVTLQIDVLEDDWVAVPILPLGTALEAVHVNGNPVELITTPQGLTWSVKKSGSHTMFLTYHADATRSEHGFSLPLVVPQAAAITLTASLPQPNLEVGVIPSRGSKTSSEAGSTNVTATIPSTSSIQLSWRTPTKGSYTMSRATYSGIEKNQAVYWTGTLDVEVFTEETLHLPLFPTSVTLTDIRVDNSGSAILVENDRFVTLIRGRGLHKVMTEFRVPIETESGAPSLELQIPRVPVSLLELQLSGTKEIQLSPPATVQHEVSDKNTIAKAYLPMTDQVTVSWLEAVPEVLETDIRANASIYHIAHAEEGILSVHAISDFEVTRGETSVFEFEVPKHAQINRVSSASGLVSDWRVSPGKEGESYLLSVFLNQRLKGELRVEVFYDQAFRGETEDGAVMMPLLRVKNIDRQRGMVALLASKDLTLKPVEEEQVTRVGENQLPASVKDSLNMSVAHTYKYFESSPKLKVQVTAPERKQGKFDALVNTLISLGDVAMQGAASIEINIKSGSIETLELQLPAKTNFLSLTAPSLRTHQVKQNSEGQRIEVQFTQEMEGALRLEVNYEQIIGDYQSEVGVPTISVAGAEVEQGRIAVEALSAVEVRAGVTEQLSSLEPTELPQQLILKTTNPILLAYKYVDSKPPYKLSLKVTRHQQIDIQAATIDSASYRTLITADGFAVTTAQFVVRNSREQFLRITLPKDSQVWSAFVDGKVEKPALAVGGPEKKQQVLIKVINSAQGFPVTLVYQTPVSKMKGFGLIAATLPRPDMVVTHSHWNVYLPEDFVYAGVESTMQILEEKIPMSRQQIVQELAQLDHSQKALTEPLQISVPEQGVRYSFEKIYANQAEEDAEFSLSYIGKPEGIWSKVGILASMGVVLLLIYISRRFLLRKEPDKAISSDT